MFAGSRFTIGYRLPPEHAYVTEMEDRGWAAGNEQFAWLLSNLGNPTSVDCVQDPPKVDRGGRWHSEICSVATNRPGHAFSTLILFDDDKVSWMQFNFYNPEVRAKGRQAVAAEGEA